MNMKEKRRHMRFNVLLNAIGKASGALKKLQINNLSKEGVGILSDEALSKGEDVEIELLIPGDNIPVVLRGEVAWTADIASESVKYASGVRLKDKNTQSGIRLLGHVYRETKKK